MAEAAERIREIREALRPHYPRFSAEEYRRRHAAVRDLMVREGLDGLLIYGDGGHCYMNMANIRWVANYCEHQNCYVVFPLDGPPTLFMSIPNILPGAAAMSVLDDVRWSTGGNREMSSSVAARVQELGLGSARLGIVGPDTLRLPHLPHHHFETLRTRLPQAQFVVVTAGFEALRRVPGAEEMPWLEKAAAFTDAAMAAMVDIVKPGVREYELYGAAHGAYLPRGGQLMFQIIGSTSMRTPRMPHPTPWPSERPLEAGDIVLTEISAAYHGYAGQIIRAVALGEPPARYREMFALARQVYDGIREVLRPGGTEHDVRRVGAAIAEAGYTCLTPLVHGWGMGLTWPYIGAPGSQGWASEGVVFQENQGLMIEPNVTTPDLTAGVVIGNFCRVTPAGGAPYQRYPLEFIVR